MESTDIEQDEKESAGDEQLRDENVPEVPAELANLIPCGVEGVHGEHSWAIPGTRANDGSLSYATCPGIDAPAPDDLGTYADMFATYLHEQRLWIGAAQQPLVFHIRKLCRRLDADPESSASIASAYLQAISRLDKQRPGNTQPAGAAGDLPGQGSIFDELD